MRTSMFDVTAPLRQPRLRFALVRRIRRYAQQAESLLCDPRLWREEIELGRLNRLTPFTPGVTNLLGFPVTYTHPQSIVAQFRSIFRQQEYCFTAANDEPRIIDCGANIGLAVLYWKSKFPKAHVIAFEPDPELARVLRSNLTSANVSDVTVEEKAVWVSDGSLKFIQQGAGGGRLGDGAITVATVRLRDFLDQDVDFLKIDIEGAEVDVLSDCRGSLDRVKNLFVEYHSFGDRPQRMEELVGVLSGAGFRIAVQTERTIETPFLYRKLDDDMDLQLNISAYRV